MCASAKAWVDRGVFLVAAAAAGWVHNRKCNCAGIGAFGGIHIYLLCHYSCIYLPYYSLAARKLRRIFRKGILKNMPNCTMLEYIIILDDYIIVN